MTDILSTCPNWLLSILVLFGMAGVSVTCGALAVGLVNWLKDAIRHLKWVYIYKHRFDKPPLAKCYCRDCEAWHKSGECEGKCWRLNWTTADNWFCWNAEPRDF